MKNVLAFFGAFNPPTRAHLELADFARRETGRDGVIFVPSRKRTPPSAGRCGWPCCAGSRKPGPGCV